MFLTFGIALSTILWSFGSILIAVAISLLVVRFFLKVKFSELRYHIEDVQNAAIGIFFKDVAIAVSFLMLSVASDGFVPSKHFTQDLFWALTGGLLTIILMALVTYLCVRWLASHNGETVGNYLRREIVVEKNEALTHLITALLLAVSIAVFGQII